MASQGLGFGGCRNTRRFSLLARQELEYRRYGVGNNEALLVQLQPLQGGCARAWQLVLHCCCTCHLCQSAVEPQTAATV